MRLRCCPAAAALGSCTPASSLRCSHTSALAAQHPLPPRLSCRAEGVRLAAALALQRLGGIGFDAQSRTKTTAQLLQGLSAAEVEQYMGRLEAMFLQGGGWQGWAGLGWAGLG